MAATPESESSMTDIHQTRARVFGGAQIDVGMRFAGFDFIAGDDDVEERGVDVDLRMIARSGVIARRSPLTRNVGFHELCEKSERVLPADVTHLSRDYVGHAFLHDV